MTVHLWLKNNRRSRRRNRISFGRKVWGGREGGRHRETEREGRKINSLCAVHLTERMARLFTYETRLGKICKRRFFGYRKNTDRKTERQMETDRETPRHQTTEILSFFHIGPEMRLGKCGFFPQNTLPVTTGRRTTTTTTATATATIATNQGNEAHLQPIIEISQTLVHYST